MAAYVDGGLSLKIGNYQLEGYNLLVLSAWVVFKRIGSKVRTVGAVPIENILYCE